MKPSRIDRRHFLRSSSAVFAGATLACAAPLPDAVPDDEPNRAASERWKKAFMLGGLEPGKVEATFRTLKDAGFEGVELISPNDLDPKEIVAARDATGLLIHGVSGAVHWSAPLSDPDPAVVKRGLDAVKQSIVDCKTYGGTTVLLVPAVVTPTVTYQQAWDRSHQAIKTVLPLAAEHKIKIAIENVWNRFLLSPLEMVQYIDSFESEWVGAYFDVGNFVEYAYPQDWIHTLGNRILKIHIKEYAKPKRFDYFLGEGEIDWKAVRQALLDIGYEGWITAEVGMTDLTDIVARMNRLLGMK